jgi:hypothetical protein
MHQITGVPLYFPPELQILAQPGFMSMQRDGMKIRREFSDVSPFEIADQEILVLSIQTHQTAQHVADIRADTEVGQMANIDADLHKDSLAEKITADLRGFSRIRIFLMLVFDPRKSA